MQDDLFQRFYTALPALRAWVDRLLEVHAARVRAVHSLGFARLAAAFPPELLKRAKMAALDPVPFPPLDALGLPEFASFQRMPAEGITFRDTFFVRPGGESESLCFHELVHVVQWSTLGEERFLLAYGLGLLSHGYRASPLERMAYDLQRDFDAGSLPPGLVNLIEQRTHTIWAQAEPVVQRGLAAASSWINSKK